MQTPEGLRRTAPRPAAGAPAPPGWPAGELSREARARLLEPQALLARGLAGPARAALESVPPEERQHPEILEFDVRVRVAAAPTPLAGTPAARTPSIAPQSAAGPRTGPAPPLPPSRHPGVDDAFVVLDDGGAVSGPELPNAAHTTLPPHAPQVPRAPLTTAPHVIPRPRADDSAGLQVDSDPLDVAQLETLLRQRVDPADAETNYQMALGLVEMGLDGQALPLLEGLLGDPARQIDATLLLVRVRRARGEVRRALKEAVAVLHAAGPAHIDLQAALTATIVGESEGDLREFCASADLGLSGARAASSSSP